MTDYRKDLVAFMRDFPDAKPVEFQKRFWGMRSSMNTKNEPKFKIGDEVHIIDSVSPDSVWMVRDVVFARNYNGIIVTEIYTLDNGQVYGKEQLESLEPDENTDLRDHIERRERQNQRLDLMIGMLREEALDTETEHYHESKALIEKLGGWRVGNQIFIEELEQMIAKDDHD